MLVIAITQRRVFKPEAKEMFSDIWQRMCRIGMPAGIEDSQKHKIIALNIANLIGILPLRLILGVNYALAGQWPSAILMAIAFTTVGSLVLLRMGGRLSFQLYRQSTILFTFICPVLLTFLLGGYEASSMVIIWSLLCPLLGLLLGEPSTALKWFYLFIVANGLALGAQGSLMGYPASPIEWRNTIAAFNVIGIGSLLFLGLRYFFNQRKIALDKLDRFAAMAAHELRNPVSTILIALNHLMRNSAELTASNQKALYAATQEAERCKHLLNDLLDMSRGKEAGIKLSLQPIDVLPVLMAAARKGTQCLDAIVDIDCKLTPQQRIALVDHDHLQQVIYNLVENSSKYANHQQPIEISIEADPSKRQLVIRVSDHGKALTRRELDQIFNPFFRAPNANGKVGSGLGLYFVRSIIETMNGKVTAEARTGGGLEVTVCVPTGKS
jgi:signal transduction histidine kinase